MTQHFTTVLEDGHFTVCHREKSGGGVFPDAHGSDLAYLYFQPCSGGPDLATGKDVILLVKVERTELFEDTETTATTDSSQAREALYQLATESLIEDSLLELAKQNYLVAPVDTAVGAWIARHPQWMKLVAPDAAERVRAYLERQLSASASHAPASHAPASPTSPRLGLDATGLPSTALESLPWGTIALVVSLITLPLFFLGAFSLLLAGVAITQTPAGSQGRRRATGAMALSVASTAFFFWFLAH